MAAVGAADAVLDLKGRAARQGLVPALLREVAVVRMDRRPPALAEGFLGRKSGELVPAPVEIVVMPVRERCPDELRQALRESAERCVFRDPRHVRAHGRHAPGLVGLKNGHSGDNILGEVVRSRDGLA